MTGSRRVVHITLEKCGSQWVKDVLTAQEICKCSGMDYSGITGFIFDFYPLKIPANTIAGPIYTMNGWEWGSWRRRGDRAIVVLRDPRDKLVSWLFSMMFSHVSNPRVDILRATYTSLASDSERLRRAIDAFSLERMVYQTWTGAPDTTSLLVRYENLVADQVGQFRKILEWLEWDVPDEILTSVIERLSFEVRSGRARGEKDAFSHFRNGIPGDWKNYFTKAHGEYWETLYPGLLRKAGYEERDDWWSHLPEVPKAFFTDTGKNDNIDDVIFRADTSRRKELESEVLEKENQIQILAEELRTLRGVCELRERQLIEKEEVIVDLRRSPSVAEVLPSESVHLAGPSENKVQRDDEVYVAGERNSLLQAKEELARLQSDLSTWRDRAIVEMERWNALLSQNLHLQTTEIATLYAEKRQLSAELGEKAESLRTQSDLLRSYYLLVERVCSAHDQAAAPTPGHVALESEQLSNPDEWGSPLREMRLALGPYARRIENHLWEHQARQQRIVRQAAIIKSQVASVRLSSSVRRRLHALMDEKQQVARDALASAEATAAEAIALLKGQLRDFERELSEKESVITELRKALTAFQDAYSTKTNFLKRSCRRLGLPDSRQSLRDVAQNVFQPRLGRLYHYPARELKIASSYGTTKLPKQLPKISIVTPSYNQGQYIETTMSSVLDQNYPNLEYHVQDGLSQDGTVEVLRRYSDHIGGWESAPDSGQSQAINRGFARTSGEIMAWLNSDDLLLPGSLAFVARYFAQHPRVDVLYGNRILIDQFGREIGRWNLPGHDAVALSWADYIPQETLFWRRSIWDAVGGRVDESFRFAMDWDLLLRFRDAGARFAHVRRYLGAFRVHSNQKTSAAINVIGEQEMNRLRERTLGRLPTHVEINEAIKPFLRRHVLVDLSTRIPLRLGLVISSVRSKV